MTTPNKNSNSKRITVVPQNTHSVYSNPAVASAWGAPSLTASRIVPNASSIAGFWGSAPAPAPAPAPVPVRAPAPAPAPAPPPAPVPVPVRAPVPAPAPAHDLAPFMVLSNPKLKQAHIFAGRKHVTEAEKKEEERRQFVRTKMDLESKFYNAYERLKNCRDNGCRLDNTVDEYINYLRNIYYIYYGSSSLIRDNSKKKADDWTELFIKYILKVGDNYNIYDIIFSKEQIESIIHKHFILEYFKSEYQKQIEEDKKIFENAKKLYELKLIRNTFGKKHLYVNSGKNVPNSMRTIYPLSPNGYLAHQLGLVSFPRYGFFDPDTAPPDFQKIYKLFTTHKRRKHAVSAYNIYGTHGANSAGLKWNNNERNIYGNIRWRGSSRSRKTRKNKRN